MGSVPRSVHVFIAGGSYAGLAAAVNLLDFQENRSPRMENPPVDRPQLCPVELRITIVDERDGFYHLIGSPLALASDEYAKKAWVPFTSIPQLQHPCIQVVQGSVAKVDIATKTATVTHNQDPSHQSTYDYDYFISATGLRRVWPVVPQSLSEKKYLAEVEPHIDLVTHKSPDGVVVIGGGAVGIEMAAELKLVSPKTKVTLVHSRDKLLSSEGLPDECKDKSLEVLREEGVEVLMSTRVKSTRRISDERDDAIRREEVEFENGHKIRANVVIWALSKSLPATDYLPREVLDDGLVKIKANLQFHNNDHYCVGDAAHWSGIKRCGAAMHMGHYAAQNIYQTILSRSLQGYQPVYKELQHNVPAMIGLAIGKQAVAYGPDQGTTYGEDVMKLFFGDDLGLSICWNYMQLGGRKDSAAAA